MDGVGSPEENLGTITQQLENKFFDIDTEVARNGISDRVCKRMTHESMGSVTFKSESEPAFTNLEITEDGKLVGQKSSTLIEKASKLPRLYKVLAVTYAQMLLIMDDAEFGVKIGRVFLTGNDEGLTPALLIRFQQQEGERSLEPFPGLDFAAENSPVNGISEFDPGIPAEDTPDTWLANWRIGAVEIINKINTNTPLTQEEGELIECISMMFNTGEVLKAIDQETDVEVKQNSRYSRYLLSKSPTKAASIPFAKTKARNQEILNRSYQAQDPKIRMTQFRRELLRRIFGDEAARHINR